MWNRISISKNLLLGLASSFIITFSACRKYEEGGRLSRGKENLTQEWKMTAAILNGNSVDSIPRNRQIGNTDGNWMFKRGGEVITHNGTEQLYGAWDLMNDKEKLEIKIDTPFYRVRYYNILRLDDQFMVWEHRMGSENYRYEFAVDN